MSEDGFELTSFQDIDAAEILPQGSSGGQAVFSPDGTKYARYSAADELRLFDFDRTTGDLSNFQLIEIPPDTLSNPPLGLSGLAFSASGRFLYCSNWDKIYQLDLEADDIEASIEIVAEWDGYLVDGFSFLPANFWLMQLAPDCRIYITMANTVDILHVIHEPDNKGLACNVQQHIELPAYNAGTMPNFPNYRLDIAPVCNPDIELLVDTTTSVAVTPTSPSDKLWIYPNPAIDYVNLAVRIADTQQVAYVISDALGQLVLEQNFDISSGQLLEETIDISELPTGMYYCSVYTDGLLYRTEKLVKVE